MGDYNKNGNLASALRRLKPFSGKDPTLFEYACHEKTSIMLTMLRPDIHIVMEEQVRSTAGWKTNTCFALPSTPGPTFTQCRRLLDDRAFQNLYAIEVLVMKKPASFLARMHKQGATGTRGNGQNMWKKLTFMYPEVTNDTIIRSKSAALVTTIMTQRKYPGVFSFKLHFFAPRWRRWVSKRSRGKARAVVQVLTEEYKDITLVVLGLLV